MSTARKTTQPLATTDVDLDVELPVGAEPTLPPHVATPAGAFDPNAYVRQVAAFCRDLQPTALLLWQAHDDDAVRTLAGQLYGLTSAVEALARVNA